MKKSNHLPKISGLAVLAGLTTLVVATAQQPAELPEMKEYNVTAGRQNFRPNEPIWPLFGVDTALVVARFDSSAWWSLEDWQGDRDYYDWNKLKGLTGFWSANNRQTAMYAWRPDPEPYVWQVVAYTNDTAGGREVGTPQRVRAGELFSGYIYWSAQEVTYRYGEHSVIHPLERPNTLRETGTWIGGADNDPEGLPYGGRAHRSMRLYIGFQTMHDAKWFGY